MKQRLAQGDDKRRRKCKESEERSEEKGTEGHHYGNDDHWQRQQSINNRRKGAAMVEWASTVSSAYSSINDNRQIVVRQTIPVVEEANGHCEARATHRLQIDRGRRTVGLVHQCGNYCALWCVAVFCCVSVKVDLASCKLSAQTLTKLAARAEQRRTRTSENCHLNSNGNIYYLYLLLQCKVRKADIKLISLHPNN